MCRFMYAMFRNLWRVDYDVRLPTGVKGNCEILREGLELNMVPLQKQ